MVARIYKPGCQADNMIVLEGKQGIRKSAALRVIGGAWFTEQHENVSGKGFFEVLQGKLLVEISEMDSFSRGEVTRVKQVVTNPSDRYRESYGRRAEDHPRQCVFVGTTNRDDWNRDETGARRFWPIQCNGEIDIAAIAANREQFFAEAVVRFKAGKSWWEMPSAETAVEQQKRYIAPAWVEPIQRYISQKRIIDDSGTRWVSRTEPLADLSIADVFEQALDMPRSQWTKANEMRAAEALRFMGWLKKDIWNSESGKNVRRWVLNTTGVDVTERCR
jgi:predicted P-loop ATPase